MLSLTLRLPEAMLSAPCAAAVTAAISFKSNEAHLPAQPHQTQAHSRLSRPHGDEGRPAGPEEAEEQGTGQAVALAARGQSPAAFDRRSIPSGLRCSSLAYTGYARSSRLARRASRRSRRDAGSGRGLHRRNRRLAVAGILGGPVANDRIAGKSTLCGYHGICTA